MTLVTNSATMLVTWR